jgi:hypothetical protein
MEWGTAPDQLTNITPERPAAFGSSSPDQPITGLVPGTRYYYRVVAQNSVGVTDGDGVKVLQSQWDEKRSIYPEDVIVTMYSLLGIDWTKKIINTPSGRAFEYIEQQSGTDFVRFREISNLFA